MQQNTAEKGFRARAFAWHGRMVGEWCAETCEGAMRLADEHAPGFEATVRGSHTSDGTYWPEHGGRVHAVRENGKWFRL